MRKAAKRMKLTAEKILPPQLDGTVERPSKIAPPTLEDVTRYRYAHGTNLGSVFVQEKWLSGAFWPAGCSETSELEAVTAWFKKDGLEVTRDRYQKHWRDYVSNSDLDWLRDVAKCNSVRLPIGWFTLGPAYCNDTAFWDVAFVYQNAW